MSNGFGGDVISSIKNVDIGLTDEGVHELCQAFINSNCYSLKLLNVMNNNITEKGMNEFKMLFSYNLFQIEDFSVANNPIQDSGFINFLNGMEGKSCFINRLYLRETGLTESSMLRLKQSLSIRDLSFKELGLSNNLIGNDWFAYLTEGLIERRLEIKRLWLFNTGLNNDVNNSIIQFIQAHLFEKLFLLDITSNEIDYDGLSDIVSAILDNEVPLDLEELWLGGCPISDRGVELLTSLIRNGFLPKLSTLCIDSMIVGIGSCCSMWYNR